MSNNVPRRWFRFSLRTMFVIITVFACWMGWESSVVRERKEMLTELKGNSAFQVMFGAEWDRLVPGADPSQRPRPVSLMRRLLGDEPIKSISYTRHYQGFSEEHLKRLEKAFPEATLNELLPEPCHPGCFPHGTLIATPQGQRPVDSISVGEYVTVLLATGESSTARVQSVFTTDNRLWKIETDGGTIITTESQPLCRTIDDVVPAGKLQPGDSVLIDDGGIHSVKVVSVALTDRTEKVFNLVLGNSEVFIANGFLARSKPAISHDSE